MNEYERVVKRILLVTGCAVGVVLVAGCASGTPEAAAGSTTSSVATSTSSTTVSTSASEEVPVTQTESSEPAACRAADLSVTRGKGGVGGGSAYYSVQFTNTSGETCTMNGFPTVSMATGANGPEIGAPSGTCDEGSSCGGAEPAVVTLEPGDVAHAKVQQANAGNLDPDKCDPQPVEGLLVTPPGDTSSVFVAGQQTGCANTEVGLIQVGAVTSGSGENG